MFKTPKLNKTREIAISIFVFSALLVSGCVTDMEQNPKQTIGKVLGAGLGALTGSQIGGGKGKLMSVAIGALAGAWFGGEIGKSLDKADRAYMRSSTQEGLEYGKIGSKTRWSNPDSGNSGVIKPTRTYQQANGQDCREFEQTVFVNQKQETATGRACRDSDGTWKIVS